MVFSRTGDGHDIGRRGESRVARAVLISALPPLMAQTESAPGGPPKRVFDGMPATRVETVDTDLLERLRR